MTVRERFYSAEDLWVMSHDPENDARRFELSEGMLIEMTPAGAEHGKYALKFGRRIGNFVEENKLGETTAAETGYVLFKNPKGKDTVRAPDVGFVTASRIPEDGLPSGYFPGAPDLAVEVISPNDEADDVQLRVTQFLKYGTHMVVLVYPKSKTVVVHMSTGSFTLSIDDEFDGGDVLPGFKVAVRDIFA